MIRRKVIEKNKVLLYNEYKYIVFGLQNNLNGCAYDGKFNSESVKTV